MSDGSQSPDSGPIAGGGPPSPFWLTKTRHDLRGPLGEILGFTEILQEEASERGLHQLVPDFRSLQQAAARIFAELNHSLTTDTILWHPDCLRELETLIQSLSTRIIAEAERLSEKCDGLNTQSFGDDLLRIGGSARRLRELAPRLLQELSQAAESAPWPARNENPAIAERDAPESPGQLENPPGAPPASGSLLIVDDHEANRALLARRLRRQGYTVSLAENGRQALEKLRARPFDLVLLDVIMPEMGGYQVLAKIKEDPALRHIPTIMISALDDLDMLARCIQKGAEDYLGKPFDPVLLRARIGSCLEKKRLHDQEQRTYQALLEAQRSLAAELAEAASYVRALLPAPLEGTIRADWRFIPCAQLGGDAFGYEWLDENCFAVYLLDVCSHGVGAALLSISVLNILRSRALPAADLRQPSDVLAALNRMFSMDSQHNLYFTMWYGVLDRRARRLTYASAGHPPAILFTGEDLASARIERLRTSGPAVGALDEAEFPSRQVELGSFNRLYVFSDGVYEIVRGDGSMMTLDEFVSNLEEQAQRQTGSLEAVLDHIQKARGSAAYSDDVALLELNFNLAAPILRPISPIPV